MRDFDLLQRHAAVVVGETMSEVLKLEREGKREEAQALIKNILKEYRGVMPAPILARYTEVARRIPHGLLENERKTLSHDAYLLKKHLHIDEMVWRKNNEVKSR
ncbi:MAG: hypothetical protein NTZ74_11125 [Chloroflexi bacterium]|nr:hypothetical protein [Chloroflexota bacterium]